MLQIQFEDNVYLHTTLFQIPYLKLSVYTTANPFYKQCTFVGFKSFKKIIPPTLTYTGTWQFRKMITAN